MCFQVNRVAPVLDRCGHCQCPGRHENRYWGRSNAEDTRDSGLVIGKLLSIDLRLRREGISLPTYGILVDQCPRGGQNTRRDLDFSRPQIFLQMLNRASTRNRDNMLSLVQQPAKRQLPGRATRLLRQLAELPTLPQRKPLAKGLKATKATSSSRQAFSTAISALRVHSEYSVCNAATGCTTWALRSVSADTSDRPTDLTLPCLTIFASAPMLSSTGTALSHRCR